MSPDKTNKESVSAIQRSIFTLCLDGAMPRASDETYRSSAAVQMLHGGGSRWNSGNRWFDKTLQVTFRGSLLRDTHTHTHKKGFIFTDTAIVQVLGHMKVVSLSKITSETGLISLSYWKQHFVTCDLWLRKRNSMMHKKAIFVKSDQTLWKMSSGFPSDVLRPLCLNSVIHGGSWRQHVGCLQTEAAAAAAALLK